MFDRAPAGTRLAIIAALGFAAPMAGSAHAQEGSLRGVVVDSADKPIPDADVGIFALRLLARTDEHGRFTFVSLPAGPIELRVRRLSYQPEKVSVVVSGAAGDSVLIRLAPSAAVLSGVGVTASSVRLREGIEDFHRRRVRGVGTYFTREDILAYNTLRTSDVLRSAPGIRFVRAEFGIGIRFNSSAIVRRDCMPMIWLDGQRAPGMEIDDLPASNIEGIELYSGPSTTPLQFSQAWSTSTCGTIVVWTRSPGY